MLSTDLANDIAIDINKLAAGIPDLELDGDYALRDISSRRSNTDEEVTIPALVGGKTYVITVSGYFGDLSPEPYGLRVRLDTRTALPSAQRDRSATPFRALRSPLTSRPRSTSTAGTNTLYVTNSARLNRNPPDHSISPSARSTSSTQSPAPRSPTGSMQDSCSSTTSLPGTIGTPTPAIPTPVTPLSRDRQRDRSCELDDHRSRRPE